MKLFLSSMALVMVLLLLGSLVGLTTKDLHMTVELGESEQAYYLAEAGLVRAQQQYALDPTWRGTWSQVPLGEGTYSVRIYDQGSTVQTESTATVGEAVVEKVMVLH